MRANDERTFTYIAVIPPLLISLAMLGSVGCTSTEMANLTKAIHDYKVTVYSGGTEIKTYHSTGTPLSTESVGFSFVDKNTGKFIRVTGTVVIEQE